MPRTPEQNREYQRAYRARRQQQGPEPAPIIPPPDDWAAAIDAPPLESTTKRQRAPRRGWFNPYDDGLPDTGELIQRMSQHARDEILKHPALVTRRSAT